MKVYVRLIKYFHRDLNTTLEESACQPEAFESARYLSEAFEEAAQQIKTEPDEEEEISNHDVDFNSDQVDYLKVEYNIEEEHPNPVELVKLKKSISTSSGAHTCEYCGKVFGRGTHLRRHLLIHTQEKHFKCKICGKAFARRDHVTIHESTCYSQVQSFGCQLCETVSPIQHIFDSSNLFHRCFLLAVVPTVGRSSEPRGIKAQCNSQIKEARIL